jgi:hypothetical protein
MKFLLAESREELERLLQKAGGILEEIFLSDYSQGNRI